MVTREELTELMEEHSLESTVAISDAVETLRWLTKDERMAVFSFFCTHCGSDDPRCQCWNDE